MFAKNKQKFKREDFVFENGWFESVVKMPGSLQMQQFQVSDCEECQIFVFDSSAGVFVDDCKYCTIFIGPSQSSLFIRDCHYLDIVCLTQQFRVRDSTNCRIWLWCESQPIIESSHHLVFSCFPTQLGYTQLLTQMKQAGLKLWNNNWFDVYDFTPMKFSIQNHHCVEEIAQSHNVIQKISRKITQSGLQQDKQIVPICLSTSYAQLKSTGRYEVVLIHPVPGKAVGLPLLHSRTAKLPENLKHLSRQIEQNTLWLFVKILPEWEAGWRRLQKSGGGMVEVVNDEKLKESLESTVFVPFGDER